MDYPQEILCRPFRNMDPPHLSALWRRAGNDRGLVPQVSTMTLESEVLAKPYFDPAGLILAELAGQPVGFIHAGFGPADGAQHQLAYELGVICLVIVPQQDRQLEIEDRLMAAAESYLQSRGAQVIYGGQASPLNPFYFGLYGGSELGGILDTDVAMQQAMLRAGYLACSHVLLLERDLAGFRPPLDRRAIQHRRQYQVSPEVNPPLEDWWQACLLANFEYTRFQLQLRQGGPALGTATFWNMEAASRSTGVSTSGLLSLEIEASLRRQGLGTFLVAESLRQLQEHGVKQVDTQTMADNTPALQLYEKLGFKTVDHSSVFRRSGPPMGSAT